MKKTTCDLQNKNNDGNGEGSEVDKHGIQAGNKFCEPPQHEEGGDVANNQEEGHIGEHREGYEVERGKDLLDRVLEVGFLTILQLSQFHGPLKANGSD